MTNHWKLNIICSCIKKSCSGTQPQALLPGSRILQVSSSFHLPASRSHPLFAFLPPPLTSFPTPLYFWAPCLLASVFFLEIVGNCPFLQSSWCYLFHSCITEKKLWERSLHRMPPQGTWVLKSSYFPEEFLSQPLKMFFFYIPSYLHITLQNTQLHSPPLPSYIKD